MSRGWCALLCAVLVGGCELQEITLATPDDIIVAEIYVHAGDSVQLAYLHRTAGENGSARVFGAVIRVQEEETGRTILYEVGADSLCLRSPPNQDSSGGTCYIARGPTDMIRAGRRYSLRIEVENRVLTGVTSVPATFQMAQPSVPVCELTPQRPLELRWTQSAGAWVYVTDASFGGLRQALRRNGVDVPGNGPVELTGLSISGADTTLVFPTEIGLFDRFDDEVHAILLAIQGGLPTAVTVDVAIAAVDRNYVNWVRGSAFNPSGQVRVPSIQGEGTGVFAGVMPVRFRMQTTGSANPACSAEQTLQPTR